MSETSPKLRAELEGIPTYKPGKPAAADGPVAYKLSSNENPYPPLPGVMETVTAAASSFNRYPDMACLRPPSRPSWPSGSECRRPTSPRAPDRSVWPSSCCRPPPAPATR